MMNTFHFYHSKIFGFILGERSKRNTQQFILYLTRLKTEAYRTDPNHLPLQPKFPKVKKYRLNKLALF
jgi:IS1 family transposase